MNNFVSYFVCIILCIFVFLCDILLPSGVINDDDDYSVMLIVIVTSTNGLQRRIYD